MLNAVHGVGNFGQGLDWGFAILLIKSQERKLARGVTAGRSASRNGTISNDHGLRERI